MNSYVPQIDVFNALNCVAAEFLRGPLFPSLFQSKQAYNFRGNLEAAI